MRRRHCVARVGGFNAASTALADTDAAVATIKLGGAAAATAAAVAAAATDDAYRGSCCS